MVYLNGSREDEHDEVLLGQARNDTAHVLMRHEVEVHQDHEVSHDYHAR